MKCKNNNMNSVVLDCSTALVSLIVLIAALFALPALMPAGYATLVAIVLFIIFMSGGGHYISKNYK
ncbi:hypothetical protein F1737_05755 [Methanoplanus sp. FWC-SCC4]|uniref:Uncharacterized protein n=1 Tax=Methanochimaera problematica TaxID=2609417 RepID=A0AA97FDJ3_9EURY|nr:hypothetical protein [Methanoplanus sp. FWC-SCC4]WOF16249.1 hypothetical protein F1737_05755 [Methanoplanus sp. FWC-SCC4]